MPKHKWLYPKDCQVCQITHLLQTQTQCTKCRPLHVLEKNAQYGQIIIQWELNIIYLLALYCSVFFFHSSWYHDLSWHCFQTYAYIVDSLWQRQIQHSRVCCEEYMVYSSIVIYFNTFRLMSTSYYHCLLMSCIRQKGFLLNSVNFSSPLLIGYFKAFGEHAGFWLIRGRFHLLY